VTSSPLILELDQAQQSFQLPPVKAYHGLAIDDGDRGGPEAQLQELLKSGGILSNVLRHEGDTLLGKKLFLLVAAASAGLRVHDNLFRHGLLPGSECRCH
jgi:hypothetical protein